VTELAGNGCGKRQSERRKSCDDFRLESGKPSRQFLGERILHFETRLIDDQRGQGVFAVGKRPDRQEYLAPVGKIGRERGPEAAMSGKGRGWKEFLPELVRLHSVRFRHAWCPFGARKEF